VWRGASGGALPAAAAHLSESNPDRSWQTEADPMTLQESHPLSSSSLWISVASGGGIDATDLASGDGARTDGLQTRLGLTVGLAR